MIMLNGRNSSDNNFISVSVKGSSVVDYCLIPQEKLDAYTDFNVILTTDLINKHCSIGSVGPSCIPDHSFLKRIICMTISIIEQQGIGVVMLKSSGEISPGRMILCQFCGLDSVRQKQSGYGV